MRAPSGSGSRPVVSLYVGCRASLNISIVLLRFALSHTGLVYSNSLFFVLFHTILIHVYTTTGGVTNAGSLRNYKSASEISGSKMPLYGSTRGDEGGGGGGEKGEGGKSDMLHFVTVNGQYQPVIRAHPGEAFRLRVVHGGNNDHMYVSLVPAADAAASCSSSSPTEGRTGRGGGGGGLLGEGAENGRAGAGSGSSSSSGGGGSCGCTLLTLARDGVYLPSPRRQGGGDGRLVLAPGSRADVAVRCDRPGVYRLASSRGSAAGGEEENGDGDGGEEVMLSIMDYLGHDTDVFEGE